MTEAPTAAVESVRSPAPVFPGSLGLFGGTFDPIHVGHLAIAEDVREALGLETVVFVPAALPPHKLGRTITEAEHRLTMVELAIRDNAAFRASDLELMRPGPSYSADTVAAFAEEARARAEEPNLVFILSTEALVGFPSWHEPERLLSLARLAVVPRAGRAAPLPTDLARRFPEHAGRIQFLGGPLLAISASAIRSRAAAGRSLRYLVPDAVAAYIRDHDLYAAHRRTDRS